jgi:hypothetical protein
VLQHQVLLLLAVSLGGQHLLKIAVLIGHRQLKVTVIEHRQLQITMFGDPQL